MWTALAIGVGIAGAFYFRKPQINVSNFDGRTVPESGLLTNKTSAYTGSTEDAESDLKTLYQALLQYRAKYRDLPSDPTDLMMAYTMGQISTKVDAETFRAPGFEASDSYSADKNAMPYTFVYAAKRADGTVKPATPKNGERDTWIVCDMYARRNTRIFPDGHQTVEPEGSFLVLWSDGTVEKVPSMGRVVVDARGTARMFFPGETGLPADVTPEKEFVEEMYRNAGPQPAPPK